MTDQDDQNVEVELKTGETHKPRITGSVIGFLLLVAAMLLLPFISNWAAEDKGVVADPPPAPSPTETDRPSQ